MEALLENVWLQAGALGLGWIAAITLYLHKRADDKANLKMMTEALNRSTEATTVLTTLFNERLPRGSSDV